MVELVYTTDLKSVALRAFRFESGCEHQEGPLAQLVEPTAHNGLVVGSNPAGTTKTLPLAQLDRATAF
jgi:hypothetical protein